MKARQTMMWVFFVVWVVGIAGFYFIDLKLWAFTWGIILAFVGIMEAVSKVTTKLTLSQRFVKLHQENPLVAWVMSAIMAAGMAALILHLML